MKKYIFYVFLLVLSSCVMYELPSEISLTGDKWIFTDYDIVVISSIQNVQVIKNDTVCINSFNNQSFVSGGTLMKQVFKNTGLDRRFVINKTMWEFDTNSHYLYCDFDNINGNLAPTHEPFWVSIPTNYWETEPSRIMITNRETGAVTNWTFETNSIGQGYASKLKLISPNIITDLYGPNGVRDKAVTIKVILTFLR